LIDLLSTVSRHVFTDHRVYPHQLRRHNKGRCSHAPNHTRLLSPLAILYSQRLWACYHQ